MLDVRSIFIYHQLWINTWRSEFKQETDSILSACWVTGLWLCFGVWSARKITHIQFQRNFFEQMFKNFFFVVVQIHPKLVWSMRNSNRRVSIDIILIWIPCYHASNWLKKNVEMNNNDTKIPQDQLEDQAKQLGAKDFVSQTKAKAKPLRSEHAGSSSRTVPMERNWIDIEPGNYSLCVRYLIGSILNHGNSLSEHEVSKKVIHLRHSQKVHREDDGAVHFRRKGHSSESIPTIYSLVWRSLGSMHALAARGGAQRRFQYCTDDSRAIVYIRAL